MILDKKEREASDSTAATEPPAYEPTSPSSRGDNIAAEVDSNRPPPAWPSSALSLLERDVKQAFPAGPSASRSDVRSQQVAAMLPVLLPPLYPPSPSSPFLLAYPPSLESIVGRMPFLSFLRALNEALAPSALEKADRAARAMPLLLGLTYGVTKALTGALTLGLARATASIMEGPESKTAAKIGKAHAAMYGRTSLPSRARRLLETVNAPSGLFPPSSNLELLLVPYATLERIQRATAGVPLSNVPAEAQRVLNMSARRSGSFKAPERRVDRAWRAVDYRRWAWLDVDLANNAASMSAASDSPSSSNPEETPARPSVVGLQSQTSSLLSHWSHQLGAHDPRRSGITLANAQKQGMRPVAGALSGNPAAAGERETAVACASGFLWSGSGRAEDALFIVVCPRGIDLGTA